MKELSKISFTKRETNNEYHGNKDYIGSTSLKLYKQSPLHYKEQKELDTPAIRFGSMYHEFILEPEVFKKNYYLFDDSVICEILISEGAKSPRATKKYKEWVFEQEEIIAGREIVTPEELQQMEAMKKVLFRHFYTRYLLTSGENELSHYTILNGVKVKVKPDVLIKKKRLIIDLKTTIDASKDKFSRHSSDLGYHISGSFYCDVCEQIYEMPGEWSFIMIAQEKTVPYPVNLFKLSGQAMAVGQYEYEILLQQHKYCIENDIYRGYDIFCDNKYGINEIDVPAYNIKEIEFFNEYK